jgi:hypothetical protein
MSLKGDYDNNSSVSASDATYVLSWIAADGPANFPNTVVNSNDGQSYIIDSTKNELNPTGGTMASASDATYVLSWIAADGPAQPNYPKTVVNNNDGQTYTIDWHTKLKWNELQLQQATSYLYFFIEIYNLPISQFEIDDGLIVKLNSAEQSKISNKSNTYSEYIQEYTDVNDKDLITDTNNPLNEIKLKTNTLYHKSMAIPMPFDQDNVKQISIYNFNDGHSYGGDTDHNLGDTYIANTTGNVITVNNKDTYIIDNHTKWLYRLRNGVGSKLFKLNENNNGEIFV